MTEFGKSSSGPKESDNRDKSLHGLIVALAMAGTIAGSVILFAHASSDGLVPDEAASTVNEVDLQTEPAPVIERVADEPADAENIEFINDTAETETLVYTNTTKVGEVPAETEEEAVNTETENESVSPTQPDEQEEENDDGLPDESELEDLIPKRLLGLLDDIADFEDEEKGEDDDDENKGKGKGHNKGDD